MATPKKKLLVTGASGFVGQHVLAMCPEYDIVGTYTSHQPRTTYSHVVYEKVDILQKDQLNKLIEEIQPDYILHLAGMAVAWNTDFMEVFAVNVMGTRNLYEAVLACRNRSSEYNPRIVYVSSAEVYGKAAEKLSSGEGLSEDSPLMAVNPYGVSKVASDRLSYMYSQREKLDIVIARPFAHAGPGQRVGFFVPDMASQIIALEKDARSDAEIMVGNLEAVRDYTDVRDVVEAYRLLLTADVARGEVFNICSGQGVPMKYLLDVLLSLSQSTIAVKQDPARLRPSDLPIYIGSAKKLHEKTGWQPKISLETTLKDALEQWRKL